ncbi:MAG: SDR family oxidoreductase [Verrucomicrobiota bacterium]
MSRRRALVTGGSGGIGTSIVRILTEKEIEVVAPPRSELNLADRSSVSQYLKEGKEFDILINNAGINHLCAVADLCLDNWDRTLEVNLTSTAILMKGCIEGMRDRGWGRVINIASIYGRVVRERRGIYSATKAALIHLSKTVAVEEAPYGILVNTVSPGFVDTPLTSQNNSPKVIAALESRIPLGRLAKPDEISRLIAFLCSEENTYLTGQDLAIDGGFTIQ